MSQEFERENIKKDILENLVLEKTMENINIVYTQDLKMKIIILTMLVFIIE